MIKGIAQMPTTDPLLQNICWNVLVSPAADALRCSSPLTLLIRRTIEALAPHSLTVVLLLPARRTPDVFLSRLLLDEGLSGSAGLDYLD